MKILILGGTRFLGRYLVEAALSNHHQITLFNRGLSNPGLFPEVEKIVGNRDGDLAGLKSRRWDAVIDTCGFISAQVRATASLLADSVEHYTFVSSISVYREFASAGQDESAPLAELAHGSVEREGDGNSYGARKVLCEQAAEEILPGRVLLVRPGIIVGPHDTTDRFVYWVRRAAAEGERLAPGKPKNPIQLIDVRDLALWIVQLVERRTVGAYNATGPSSPLTFVQMLEACGIASQSRVQWTWVDDQFLLDHGVTPFVDLPFWIPTREERHAGFFAIDCAKAFRSGLKCRPLNETARDTLFWDRGRDQKIEPSQRIGLRSEQEHAILREWIQQHRES